jgi:hypothetical protein
MRVSVILAILAGCDTTTLPPAEKPGFTPGWFVQGRFFCWNGGTRECYLAESEAEASDSNRGWGANFALSYNPVNGRALSIDGESVSETESADPPADTNSYTLLSTWTDDEMEVLDPAVVEGEPDSFLWLYPARSPQSPSHGEVSVFTMKTTSGNPLHQGTSDAEASTSVEFTYVRRGRCRIDELHLPGQLEPGQDFEVTYRVENCKRARLYVYGVEAGTSMLPGHTPPADEPTEWTDTDEMEEDLEGSLTFTAPARGGYVSAWLEADDALGVSVDSPVETVQIPSPAGEEPTGEADHDPDCLQQPYTVRQECDGPGGDPIVQCVDIRACTEDEAMEQAEEIFASDGFDAESGGDCSLELSQCW